MLNQSIVVELSGDLRKQLESLDFDAPAEFRQAQVLLNCKRLSVRDASAAYQRVLDLARVLQERAEMYEEIAVLLEAELKRAEIERAKYLAAVLVT